MARQIFIPVVLPPRSRNLWSENGVPNGIRYEYCAAHCLSAEVHCGHDVEAIYEPIFAATDGLVKFAGYDGWFTPNHVDIEPTVGPFRGEYHIYAHLSEAWVTTGQTVRRGDRIGTTGTNCTDSSCSVLDRGNEHLHWERRGVPGFTGCSLDPDPVLTSPNANGPDGPISADFDPTDRIRVDDGPLRLRQGPGSSFAILQDLPTGAQLCVTGDPQSGEGFDWYPVLVTNINQPGWVAGAFCVLLAPGGCAGGQETAAAPVPEGAAKPGQPISPHPDSAPDQEAMAELEARMPTVEYDETGNVESITIPIPSAPEAAEAGQTRSSPWANG